MKKNRKKIKEEILNAANRRFGHYGYSKTTMAEIATDCSMSAANLYRYFRDKSAIGAGIASRYFKVEIELLNTVADNTELTAAQRVQEYILTPVRYNFKEFNDSPEIMELVEHICTDGAGLIENHRNEKIGILSKILTSGVQSGEFVIEDLEETATSIHIATLVFHATPLFLMFKNHCSTEEEMVTMAEKVACLMLKGITRADKRRKDKR